MGLLDGIVETPQWQAFQAQLVALLSMVQDTNVRVRRQDEAIGKMQTDLHQIKNAGGGIAVCKECQEIVRS